MRIKHKASATESVSIVRFFAIFFEYLTQHTVYSHNAHLNHHDTEERTRRITKGEIILLYEKSGKICYKVGGKDVTDVSIDQSNDS